MKFIVTDELTKILHITMNYGMNAIMNKRTHKGFIIYYASVDELTR